MSKNTLLAFILILGTVSIFNSPWYNKFYYEHILHKPYPDQTIISKVIEKSSKEEQVSEDEVIAENQLESNKTNETQLSGIDTPLNISNVPADTVWVETNRLKVGISENGAKLISIKMKQYKYSDDGSIYQKKNELVDLIPHSEKGVSQLTIGGENYDEKIFKFDGNIQEPIIIKNGETTSLSFKHNSPDGVVEKIYLFNDNSYKIGMNIKKEGLGGKRIIVSWNSGIEESELDKQTQTTEKRRIHYSDGDNIQHLKMSKEGKESASGEYKWIGISSKYFFVSIVADSMSNADLAINSFYVNDKYSKKNSNVNYGISYEKTADNNEVKYWFYAGPSQYKELKQENIKFEKILFPVIGWTNIFFWADSWFPLLAEFVLRFLLFLTSFVKDYGISIALITIISKVITYPMTHSSTKTMNKMKDVTPKANQLREKYKNNSKKMNEELMELYRKEGVNPLNPGCLPMFLQMPIFIALYVVLKKAIELRGASTFIIPWVKDLSKPETLFSLTKIFPDGLPWYGSSVALMPIVMAVITFFQNKMTIKDPNQKMMIYFMPIFMLVLFNNFPAGLVYYWTLSSGLTLIQQYFTTKYTTNNPTVIVEKKQVKNRYNGAK